MFCDRDRSMQYRLTFCMGNETGKTDFSDVVA